MGYGRRTMCASVDGSEALEVAWRERPDLVLLDVGLPKLSGVDVCRALKTSPSPQHVILITGDAQSYPLLSSALSSLSRESSPVIAGLNLNLAVSPEAL